MERDYMSARLYVDGSTNFIYTSAQYVIEYLSIMDQILFAKKAREFRYTFLSLNLSLRERPLMTSNFRVGSRHVPKSKNLEGHAVMRRAAAAGGPF